MRLRLYAKCNDLAHTRIYYAGAEFEQEGYPPSFTGICGSDYVEIEVDLTTGRLIGFDPKKFQEEFTEFLIEQQNKRNQGSWE